MPATSGLDMPAPAPASGAPSGPVAAPARFAVVGAGSLGAAIAEALAAPGAVDRKDESDLHPPPNRTPVSGQTGRADAPSSPGSTALVVATEAWDPSGYPRARRACAEAGLPWLPVRAELGTVVIGPLEQAGAPGCVECWQIRRRRARQGSEEIEAVWQRHSSALATRPSSWMAGLAADTVGVGGAEGMARVAEGELRDTRTHPAGPAVEPE